MKSKMFHFLPVPRQITTSNGSYPLGSEGIILLPANLAQTLSFGARRFQAALVGRFGINWQLSASPFTPLEQVGLVCRLSPEEIPHSQGYHLSITPQGMLIKAHDAAGIFYAFCTLIQVLKQVQEPNLPCLEIDDHPDFPARGVMLDISRDKVYSTETLYELVDRLASWKINQLQLYTEHTFAYRAHPEPWKVASPMTGDEILALDAYCRDRFIELVPNQNSFGHMARWLKHARYAHLAEIHGEFDCPWGKMQGPFSVAPEHPGSLELISSLYDELLPHFSSRSVNVGCDETIDLGVGQSKTICEQRGTGRVYLDFLKKIYADVTRRGYTMQFWGDIIIQHPELVSELPHDAIALEWGYDADHPFAAHGAKFAASGIPFYVCPGTSAWNTLAGRTDNALANLASAAANGLKYGALGYLNTDWGDGGHWQVPPVSWLGFSSGAAYSWCLGSNTRASFEASPSEFALEDTTETLSLFAFDDPTGTMGRLAYALGNAYLTTQYLIPNATSPNLALYLNLDQIAANPNVKADAFQSTVEHVAEVMAQLHEERMTRPDAGLIVREFMNTARLFSHGCQRVLLALEKDPARAAALKKELGSDMAQILVEYRSLWLARCRPGGLPDSTARFEALLKEYA